MLVSYSYKGAKKVLLWYGIRRYSSGKEEKRLRSRIIGYSSYKSAIEASSSKRIEVFNQAPRKATDYREDNPPFTL